MQITPEPDIWTLLFEQTPFILRVALSILTFGLFTLAAMLWRWNRADLQRVEKQVHSRMDRVEGKIDTLLQRSRND